MKKFFCALLCCLFCASLWGCSGPDSLKLDLYQGYGKHRKLLHLNASSGEKRERMEAFGQAVLHAQPLEKDPALFAYYPDYDLEITPWEGGSLRVTVDINGDYVDLRYPEGSGQGPDTLYRSSVSAQEFLQLVHQ